MELNYVVFVFVLPCLRYFWKGSSQRCCSTEVTYLTLEHTFLLKHEHLKPGASLDVNKKHGAEGLASSASVKLRA